MKLSIHGFLGSLIMNPLSGFENSKPRIQYVGRRNTIIYDNIRENVYPGVFRVAVYESL